MPDCPAEALALLNDEDTHQHRFISDGLNCPECLPYLRELATERLARQQVEQVLVTEQAKTAVHGGEWCAQNRAEGRGPCGACAWCCQVVTAERDAARAEAAELRWQLRMAATARLLNRAAMPSSSWRQAWRRWHDAAALRADIAAARQTIVTALGSDAEYHGQIAAGVAVLARQLEARREEVERLTRELAEAQQNTEPLRTSAARKGNR